MVYFQKMTPEGYKQIKDEIACLKKGRPRRIKILQAARALGDLSENTEYTEEYKIVGRMEADLADGKISFGSPLGQAIMKKEAGTTSTVEAPAGEYKVTIVEVK
ncbi:transcription elongation factor GreA [Lactobacillus amylovorus subsp. animalium]|mgnify:FL=1|jgi:transcription elongation factor GreA|uniref:GreA protein n=1 Tax=Lactobacillus amylovorus subsp. animalium DSM 16698 TaxID=695563 RepID=A0A0R2KAX4_LACAM|nr:GreA/GreB family elongation factor [Lactobacillus amylovorus]AUX15239.1 transcription elongation factor GreA [Lactobacillus amylovorus]KRN86656.1 greA protein [Lactobacillus amylovorus DSM 16698]MCI7161590.1 GreA/GreB family elongation factor [Lactobacillus amylovorus]MCT3600621.1 transcription elongation factor GreA [Lactobacillus amylovorus]MDB6227287.1 GreA/GreB family elongation factor [Lactobacillus amylovorus]